MDFKQSTFGEIIESEREMILKGAELYEEFFINAFESNDLLITFIKSIDDLEKEIFLAFLSQVRKHNTLALFSSVRLHHNQAGMNLRQVLEAGTWSAYAIAHPDPDKFCEKDSSNILHVPKKLEKARNTWLDKNFKAGSDKIKKLKDLINNSVAHSNIIYSFQNFEVKPVNDPGFNLPFFDLYDEHKVKADLWLVANTSLMLIDLFYGVNLQYKTFQFIDDFIPKLKALVAKNNSLKEQMMSSEKFIQAKKLLDSN